MNLTFYYGRSIFVTLLRTCGLTDRYLYGLVSMLMNCVPDSQTPGPLGRRTVLRCTLFWPNVTHTEADTDRECSIYTCVSIEGCPLEYSVSEILETYRVEVTPIKSLYLVMSEIKPDLTAGHFAGLEDLEKLTFENPYYDIYGHYLTPNADFLERLQKLRSVTFRYVKLPPLPLDSAVEEATFIRGISTGAFGGCQELQTLHLEYWQAGEDRWLAGCPNLTHLTILNSRDARRTLRGATDLKHLRVNYCRIAERSLEFGELDGSLFEDLASLVTLDLSSNGITYLPKSDVSMPNLEELYLRDNNLQTEDPHSVVSFWIVDGQKVTDPLDARLYDFIRASPKLRVLDVSGNEEYNICMWHISLDNKRVSLRMVHPNLRRLILDGTSSTIHCITKKGLPELEYLSLVGYKYTTIHFHNYLPPSSNLPLTILLGGHPGLQIFDFFFTNDTYDRIYDRSVINSKLQLRVVNVTSLNCDCANVYLIRALKEGVIDGEFVTCEGYKEKYEDLLQKNITTQVAQQVILNQMDMSKLECFKYSCDPCVCRESWSDSYVTADCTRSNFRGIPRLLNENVQRLEVAHNQIMKISEKDFNSTLEFMDLSNNLIAHIDKETTSRIFSRKIRLRLSGNPIACDCDNYHFLKSLREHSYQVEDYANLSCLNEGVQFLSEVNVGELCQELREIQDFLVVGAAFLVFTITALVVQIRYSRSIKIFVYARGWCGWRIKEDMIDADKLYDVFVAFCHLDAAIVLDEVLPKLESLGYRTCVHLRDWAPGEFIPNQITRSVEASRRTMVFLSQNFLESMWAMLEFRTALSQAVEDGIPRVIMVLLHEFDDTAVEPDLRSFLQSNTYVQWGDPWFWDKIQYALPSRRAATPTSDDGNEAIEMIVTNCDNVQSPYVETAV